MDLPKIKVFLTAAECLNFSETARRLNMAQPNVSKIISFLEADLGVALFYREKGGLTLTPSGQILYSEYLQAMAHVEQGRMLARQYTSDLNGSLRIGMFDGFDPDRVLLHLPEQFCAKNPGCNLQMELCGMSELRFDLQSDEIDLCVSKEFDISDLPHIKMQTLSRGEPVLLMNCSHPLATIQDASPEEISKYGFVTISPSKSMGGYKFFMENCESMQIEPHIEKTVSNLQTLFYYVHSGLIAIVDRNYANVTWSEFCSIPLLFPSSYNVLSWDERNKNPMLHKFLAFCREKITTENDSKIR